MNTNNQSNAAKGRIAVASTLNYLFVFLSWQHRTNGLAADCSLQLHVSAEGFTSQIVPSPGILGTSV